MGSRCASVIALLWGTGMAVARDTLSGVAAVVGAVAWPLVIVALIVALRRVLPSVVVRRGIMNIDSDLDREGSVVLGGRCDRYQA